MCQTCDPDQIGEMSWMSINKHLHSELRTKLRDSKTSQFTAADILRTDPKCLGSRKQGHDILLIQRNRSRTDAGKILQHPDHGGVIVTQHIQLQEVILHAVVFKMGGDDITVFVICRMLYRSKFLNFLTHGQYNDTSRMLSGRTADTGTALYNTVDLTVTLVLSPLFKIILHINLIECIWNAVCIDL